MKRKLIVWSTFAIMSAAFTFFLGSCQKDEMSDLVVGSTEGLFINLSSADGSCVSVEVPLLAGQHNNVGNVIVTTDTENEKICVTYVLNQNSLDEGWRIYETHLAIVTDKDDFPTTRQGNPVPGRFPYGDDELDGVEKWTFCLDFADLEVVCDDMVYIAAHAVVKKIEVETGTIKPELTWSRSSEENVLNFEGRGGNWTKEDGFAIDLSDELLWDGGTAYQNYTEYSTRNDISWASWKWIYGNGAKWPEFTKDQEGRADLRRFQATFDIPEGYVITAGKLTSVNPGHEDVLPMNDNIYIFVNGELLFWGGTILAHEPAKTFLGMEGRNPQPQNQTIYRETDGWFMLGSIPEITSFTDGENVIDIFVEEYWGGGGMHELELTLDYEKVTVDDETAWGDGDRFVDRGNWATYFTYTICCDDGNGNGDCRTETAFGGDTGVNVNSPGGWWYYYDASVAVEQKIWAGQNIDVGTVKVEDGTLYIILTDGWELQDGNETVKIQGYNGDDLPESRPALGAQNRFYAGTDFEISVPEFDYYVIHLDVKLCP